MESEDIEVMIKNKDIDGLINFILTNNNRLARIMAADQLVLISDESIIEPLLKIVNNESIEPERRADIMITLGGLKDPIVVEPLIKLLDHPDDDLKFEVIATLGEIGDSRAVDPLIECLQDPYDLVRSYAVDALRGIGDPKGVNKAEETFRELPKIITIKKTPEELEFSKKVDRNQKGKELEKNGEVDKAIILYEKNIEEDFTGSFPYDRLAIIYRRRKEFDEEIRVLEKAISVFENLFKGRADREPKLKKFYNRLNKARLLKEKK